MNTKNNWKILKKRIERTGGLVITNRQVGKSKALRHILKCDDKAIILLTTFRSMNNFLNNYRLEFHSTDAEIIKLRSRVFSNYDSIISKFSKTYIKDNLYIDEYFFQSRYIKYFRGAFSTMAFPVQILKMDNHLDYKNMKNLTEEQISMEDSLDFSPNIEVTEKINRL